MKFVLNLALSRMKRQKKRLFFVLLAIAASSCLVVWTIGGFQALFIDETTQEANFLGEYDLRVASKTFGATMGKRPDMGEFVNPTKRENYASRPMISEHPSATSNASPNPSSTQAAPQGRSSGGSPGGRPGGGKGSPNALNRPGGRASTPVLDERLVQELRHDDSVSRCDEVAILRMFVYAPGTEKAILEDADAEDEGDRKTIKRSLVVDDSEIDEAPEGMDPELHRRAFGAYRSTMGTPMGMGSTFWSTTATESPYELEDGRWLSATKDDSPAPKEAVMTVKGAEKYGAKVGDPLALLAVSTQSTRAIEFQLSVVGIVDDPDCDGFYVSEALGRELAQASGAEYGVNAVFLKLRSDVDAFRSKWSERLTSAPGDLEATTKQDLVDRRIAVFKQEQSFKYQAVSGALLASLAALLIVFTALNTSVDDERRLIAFYRVAGLTRSQIAASILGEGFVLAIPGWIAGMAAGWVLVFLISGKPTGINLQTSGLSFLCTVVGAIFAALYPMFRATRVAPLEALGVRVSSTPYAQTRRRTRRISAICAVVGLAALSADAALIRATSFDAPTRAAIHSGLGVLALALGVILMIPSAIYATEWLVVPIASRLMRVDSRSIRRELSGNASRVVAVAVALSVGGGLFATMQIWGYSMLDPFLPGRRAPDAFAAFLPNGLSDEGVDELRRAPMVDPDRFLTVAVEQAAFAAGSIPVESQKSQFANVVFFGVDVAKAFEGEEPMVGVRFRQGNPEDAFEEMKSGRGVIVTDSLSVDYALNLGDTLRVVDPRDAERILDYPIVGVVSFPGWQWLSKTGGVRRNFGRSGGIVFAREGVIANDYSITRRSYFWFNAPNGTTIDYSATEAALDQIALSSLKRESRGKSLEEGAGSRTAYVKLSTRESLTESISGRADSVIWGLSKTPLTTLVIAAIAVVGAVANSVRARRWEYGVMRALGTTRSAIVRMILVEAAMIGIVACVTSFVFGFLAAQGALKLGRSMFGTQDPPLILPVDGLLLGLGLTVALCVAAALYPAIKTGRTDTLRLLQSGRTPE